MIDIQLIEQFHAHLKTCKRCESSPFNLCQTGIGIITKMQESDRLSREQRKAERLKHYQKLDTKAAIAILPLYLKL